MAFKGDDPVDLGKEGVILADADVDANGITVAAVTPTGKSNDFTVWGLAIGGGKDYGVAGSAGINVRAIAQGASERNISVVIDGRSSAKALRAVHSSFYLSAHTVSIGLIGPGLVGGALLDQLASQVERLRRDFKLDLRVRGIAGSKSMRLVQGPMDLARWRDEHQAGEGPVDLERFADHIHADQFPHAVIIDCSASAEVAKSSICARFGLAFASSTYRWPSGVRRRSMRA